MKSKERNTMKKWQILNTVKKKDIEITGITHILLENRGLKKKKEIEEFLHPDLSSVTPKNVGIDTKQLLKALKRIEKAIKNNEQIVVFGDYDVDGITGSAILWETLYEFKANCLPFIPDRKEEGYGLSIKALQNDNLVKLRPKLIITVDNGIVANEAVAFANMQGIDVIITDHHTVSDTLPEAYAIVHTTKLCGAGVAYLLSRDLRVRKGQSNEIEDTHLELAALGTVADLVPLTGANRAIVTKGLEKLRQSKRPGLLAMLQQARVIQDAIGVYEIGYIIGPRLNASGRIASAMDSLRLLCTRNNVRAQELAAKLESTNRERQQLLKDAAEHALKSVRESGDETNKILIIGHESYEEGVIGLVAGRLVEAFYRPAIVLSLGDTVSKASARSISGFNIIEFLRMHIDHFINIGGHPMAAGFTIETAKISALKKILETNVKSLMTEALLTRTLKIDFELPFSLISEKLYNTMQDLSPFGMANPEPVFATRDVIVEGFRVIGKDGNHLRLFLKQNDITLEAIAFGMGDLAVDLKTGNKIDVAYVLNENTWNGDTKLQLKVKDILLNL
jgi:single-stranded-DNA-specific exonuclease